VMTCLIMCSNALPSGFICEDDLDCSEPDRLRIVTE